jgi:hypothetical protein
VKPYQFYIIISIACLIVISIARPISRFTGEQGRRETTSILIEEWIGKLSKQIHHDGRYVRYGGKDKSNLPVKDGWGMSIRVLYVVVEKKDFLQIYSAGPDRNYGTEDDIFKVSGSIIDLDIRDTGEDGESVPKG